MKPCSKGIWSFIIHLDSLSIASDGEKVDQDSKLLIVGINMITTAPMLAAVTHMLFPFGIAIKDPETYVPARKMRKLRDGEREELRSELVKILAVVTEELKKRGHDIEAYNKAPDPPERIKSIGD